MQCIATYMKCKKSYQTKLFIDNAIGQSNLSGSFPCQPNEYIEVYHLGAPGLCRYHYHRQNSLSDEYRL